MCPGIGDTVYSTIFELRNIIKNAVKNSVLFRNIFKTRLSHMFLKQEVRWCD